MVYTGTVLRIHITVFARSDYCYVQKTAIKYKKDYENQKRLRK